MMNFDMVGRLRDNVLQLLGFETSTDWASLVWNANRPNLVLFDPPTYCAACSDFACFKNQGIPHLWFFTGTHEQYHTPADDVDLINFQGLADITEIALRVLVRMVVRPEG